MFLRRLLELLILRLGSDFSNEKDYKSLIFYILMKKIPPCGAICENCLACDKPCKGCHETGGRPYFYKNNEKCPVFECSQNKQIEHCGLCDSFPCDIFLNKFDPDRGIITALRRAGLLSLRKKIGTEKWIKWVIEKKIEFGP
jgi:hypothetical protein